MRRLFDRVLVALDGSVRAEAILTPLGTLLAGAPGSDVTLVTVVAGEPREGYAVPEAGVVLRSDDLRAAVERYHARTIERFTLRGVRSSSRVRTGRTAEEIVDLSAELEVDLVALTTHGRSGLARWRLGSVAEKVLRASRAPVLALRSFPGGPALPDGAAFRRILVPVDGSGLSLAVRPLVAKIVGRTGAAIEALYVDDAPIGSDIPDDRSRGVLDAIARSFREAGLEATSRFRRGDPAATIVDAAAEGRFDLVAMSTHGRSGLGRWMLGSVAEKVLRHGTTSILLAPARSLQG